MLTRVHSLLQGWGAGWSCEPVPCAACPSPCTTLKQKNFQNCHRYMTKLKSVLQTLVDKREALMSLSIDSEAKFTRELGNMVSEVRALEADIKDVRGRLQVTEKESAGEGTVCVCVCAAYACVRACMWDEDVNDS
jgi:hypothetical protein